MFGNRKKAANNTVEISAVASELSKASFFEGFSADELDSLGALRGGGVVRQHHDVPAVPPSADVVYTTRWQSMGEARNDPDWLARFAQFAVTEQLVTRFSGSTGAADCIVNTSMSAQRRTDA